jgi:hypothetical protein
MRTQPFNLIEVTLIAIALLVLPLGVAAAQTASVSAQAILTYTAVDPVPGDSTLGEAQLEQPVIMGRAGLLNDHLRALATLDLEGLTMPGGALTLGGWGEGFNERRHPHTYMHELVISAAGNAGPVQGSLTAGKGFVPFGSDDPMSRPAVRYPVNHHWSQILERAMLVGGLRITHVMVEAALFNGDEPERPGQWPNWSRFGDSWSARATIMPLPGLEVQGSRAHVKSPEHRPGFGTDQDKWSVSARFERMLGRSQVYALLEWARTDEASLFRFQSWLGEGSWTYGRSRAYYRFESTDRPEEERSFDVFRSVRPHLENSIVGVTRWNEHTAGYGFTVPVAGRMEFEPVIELSVAKVREIAGGLFDVQGFFGNTTLFSVTVGARLRLPGAMRSHRMGRYGVAESGEHQHH